MLPLELKRKKTDELEVEELAAQFVVKIEQLIGTTASREFTCLGVVYSVPEARELMDIQQQICVRKSLSLNRI